MVSVMIGDMVMVFPVNSPFPVPVFKVISVFVGSFLSLLKKSDEDGNCGMESSSAIPSDA